MIINTFDLKTAVHNQAKSFIFGQGNASAHLRIWQKEDNLIKQIEKLADKYFTQDGSSGTHIVYRKTSTINN